MGNYSVYMHVNKTNGKRYIGITSQVPSYRWKNGAGYKKQKRFYSAILSYGWDGFEHYVLQTGLTKAEAEKAEEDLIRKYRSNDLSLGYNIENGGVTNKLSEEQKAHLRDINTGRKHSEETKRKMSIAHIGQASRWLIGQKQSAETIAKRFAHMSGAGNPKARKVYQYDLNGIFVREYECMAEAKQALGLSSTAHISMCCAGKRKQTGGYMWRYEYADRIAPYVNARREVVNGW